MSTHRNQRIGESGNLGLTRGIPNDRATLGSYRRHQDVPGCAHGGDIEVDFRTFETVGAIRDDVTLLDRDSGSQRFHPLQVKIYGPRPPGTASRKRNAGSAGAREE